MQKDESFLQYAKELKENNAFYSEYKECVEDAEYNGYLECVHMTFQSLFKHKLDFFLLGFLTRRQAIQIGTKKFVGSFSPGIWNDKF